MNLVDVLKLFVFAVVFFILILMCGKKIYDKNIKLSVPFFLLLFIYVSIFIFTYIIGDITIFIASQIFMTFIIHKNIFESYLPKVVMGIVIYYFVLILVKAVCFPIYIVLKKYDIFAFKTGYIYVYNILALIISYICMIMFGQVIRKIINKHRYYTNNNIIIMVLINTIIVLIILFRIPIIDENNINAIISMIMIIYMDFVTIKFIKQKNDIDNYRRDHQELEMYSKFNEELLDEYKKVIQDDKNQFIVLKSLIDTNNKEALRYINKIIKNKTDYTNNYLQIKELNYIPILSFRGLLNYKIREMRAKNINVEVIISSEVSSIKQNTFSDRSIYSLYMLVKILLNDAINNVVKNSEKQLCIQVYEEINNLCITIGEVVSEDFNKRKFDSVTEGLVIENIINENKMLSYETNIIDNFYIQTVKLKFEHLPKNTNF